MFNNSVKKIAFVLVVFFLFISFSVHAADQKCKIGYGYATTVMSQENQEHFLLGFEYGLKEGFARLKPAAGPCQKFEDIKIVQNTINSQSGPLGAVKAANSLVSQNVLMLAGFATSHEALLAARVAQKNKMAFVSVGATANGLDLYKDYVFTTSPQRKSYAKALIKGWTARHKGKEILVVAKKDFVFSMDILDSLKKENEKDGAPLKLIPIYVDENLALDKTIVDKIDFSNISGVYITLYSSISRLAFLELTRRLKNDAVFYVSSSWISHHVDFFNEISEKTKKRVVAFGAGIPKFNDVKLNELRSLYRVRFKEDPSSEVFEGYEGGVFVAHVLYNAKAVTREAVLNSLINADCVSVNTRDKKLCRTKLGFSNKSLYFYQWTPSGYVPEEI